jgi:hypothetical protein
MKPELASIYEFAFSLDLLATWRLIGSDKPLAIPGPLA